MLEDIDKGMTLPEFTAKWGKPDKNSSWDDPKRIHFGAGGVDVSVGPDGKLQRRMIYLPL
jgi:hypothetical protein